jgi:hypothetical protein
MTGKAQGWPGSSEGFRRASPEAPVLIATAGPTIYHDKQHEEDAEGGENQAEVHGGMAMSDGFGSKSFKLSPTAQAQLRLVTLASRPEAKNAAHSPASHQSVPGIAEPQFGLL